MSPTRFADVTNSGSITAAGSGIDAGTNATVTNHAGASITGGQFGIAVDAGFANVVNSGSITATFAGISAQTDATVTNNAGASITGGGGGYGIVTNTGFANVINSGSITGGNGILANTAANVTNSGSITGTANYGIYAGTNATVTNNASAAASITGGKYGIRAAHGFCQCDQFRQHHRRPVRNFRHHRRRFFGFQQRHDLRRPRGDPVRRHR